MSATGLDVFDRTLQTTHIWLDELMETVGPDRQVAWHALGAVLRVIRDRVPAELAANLGSQLPILVRGLYYDQWRGVREPKKLRDLDEFLHAVSEGLTHVRPVNVLDATRRENPARIARGRAGDLAGRRARREERARHGCRLTRSPRCT
jgi:uncharacterized protein (DUF2267 family)